MPSPMNELARTGNGRYRDRDLELHPPPLTPAYRSSIFRSPAFARIRPPAAPSDSFGPVFGHDLLGPDDNDLLVNFARPGHSAIGERILVHGRLKDEFGRGVPETLIEVWQANAGGRYRHPKDIHTAPLDPDFGGSGRMMTDGSGNFSLRTIKPGPYPWINGGNDWRPSHIHFSLFGHSFVQRLVTQMYFEGDPLIRTCPIAGSVPDREAIDRMIARFDLENTIPMDIRAYRFDIVLRGRNSTMFENRIEGN